MSLKLRLTALSFVLFVATLSVAGWFVLRQHEGAALDALDDGLVARLDDLAALDEQGAIPEGFGISEAEDTLAMVVAPSGAVELTTDRFGDPREILELVDPDTGPTTVALSTFAETRGIAQMRVLVANGPNGQIGITAQSVDSVDQSVADLRSTLLLVGPILALLGAAATGLVVRRALVPVEAIRRQASEITLSDLHRRIPERGRRDELATLAETLNDMLSRLEQSAEAQRDLVADAAHELRSPLTALVTQLEVDLTHPDDADWPVTAAEALLEARRLQALIDSLLLLARLDHGAEPTMMELVDLDDIVHVAAHSHHTTTRVAIDRSGVGAGVVRGDPNQLRSCLQNLVDNAVRHAESWVTLALLEQDGTVVVTVTDDGAGIAAEERERVFQRFYRVSEARDRPSGGSGLGLAIVHDLISAHGGTITAGAAQPSGTTMTVRLPAANSAHRR